MIHGVWLDAMVNLTEDSPENNAELTVVWIPETPPTLAPRVRCRFHTSLASGATTANTHSVRSCLLIM